MYHYFIVKNNVTEEGKLPKYFAEMVVFFFPLNKLYIYIIAKRESLIGVHYIDFRLYFDVYKSAQLFHDFQYV